MASSCAHAVGSSEPGRDRSDRWRELSLVAGRGQARASDQNFGYRAGGRTSEVTVTHSEPREEPVTRPSLREYAAVQRERYLAATRAEKGTLLSEVVTVTGLHRRAAIRLLRRPPRAPTARSRAGRTPSTFYLLGVRGRTLNESVLETEGAGTIQYP